MTSEEKQKAEAIVKEWFWQPDSWHRKSVVRYYESAPIQPDILQLVIAYLKQEETDTLFILQKGIQLGETWKATDAWFQTSPSDKWAGTESTKVRIYQAFKPKADENDGPYTIENGCKYKVTHEFHWDVGSVPELPASSSGVQYTLQGVTRDKDSGLYSCVIEKRETVQQDVAIYRTGGSVFATVEEEQHLGVKAGSVGSAGLRASAGAGIVVTRTVRKNADCTSDVINQKTTEVQKRDAVVTVERTLRGTRETVLHRNEPAALAKSGLAIGERRTSRMTDGGRYDNETTVSDGEPAGEISSECGRTIFEHVDAKTVNQKTAPSQHVAAAGNGLVYGIVVRKTEDGNFDVTNRTTQEIEVPNAVVVERMTSRGVSRAVLDRNVANAGAAPTDVGEEVRSEKTPGGRFNVTRTKVSRIVSTDIGETCERQTSVHSHSTETVSKNKPNPIEREAAAGIVVRRQARRNELGTWDVVDTETQYAERRAGGSGGAALAQQTSLAVYDARTSAPSVAPSVNVDVAFSSMPTERGTFNVQETVTRHIPAKTAGIEFGSASARTVVVTGINQTQMPTGGIGGQNIVKRLSASLNERGSMSTVEETTTYSPAETIARTSWASETSVTRTVRHNTMRSVQAALGTSSADPDDAGAATTRITEYTPRAIDTGWITWTSTTRLARGTYKYKHGIRVFMNLHQVPTPPSGSNCTCNVTPNKFGLFDGHLSYTDLIDWVEAGNGSGAAYGGIQMGTAKFYQYKHDALGKTWKRIVEVPIITYYGSGNEGSEAKTRAKQIIVAGFSPGGGRTYATGAPNEGQWQAND